jgi:hypothetical protein
VDQASQKKLRDALIVLAGTLPDSKGMYGARGSVDPVRHLHLRVLLEASRPLMESSMKRVPLVLLVILLAATDALAQTGAPLSGTFSSKGAAFEIAGGAAFTGTSSLDRQTPVILVAISNTKLNVGAVADFVDRKRAIEHLVKDDETPIVYLEFTPQGRWRGLSYYFAPGNGCGYCTSEATSTVQLTKGRLTGTVKSTEKDRPFNVVLDIEVLNDDHGAPLPTDGDAAGKAYLAYHAALVKADAGALKPTLSPGNLEVFARAQRNNDVAGYVSYLAEKHPLKSVRITKGWSTAAKASLLIEGESAVGKVSGEVFLINTKGVWGVDEELVDLVLDQ